MTVAGFLLTADYPTKFALSTAIAGQSPLTPHNLSIGLAHFVFADGSFIVQHARTATTGFLAVDPFDPDSWGGYLHWMRLRGILRHVLTPNASAPGAPPSPQVAWEDPDFSGADALIERETASFTRQ